MAMSVGVAWAAETDYQIIIDNAVKGETYSAYKIFDVTYSGDNEDYSAAAAATTIPGEADTGHAHTAYSYTISTGSEWWATVTSNHATTEATAGTTFTANGLTFTKTTTSGVWNVAATADFDAAAFAVTLNGALTGKTEAATGSLEKSASSTADYELGSLTLNVGNTGAGYYFVNTTTGSLCSLDTTENTATIREKNSIPSVTKTVSDASDGTFGENTTVSIGDTVYYKIEITDGTGTDAAIKVHDTLSNGQTLNIGSFAITDNDDNTSSISYSIIYSSSATVSGTAGSNVESGTLSDGCTFEINFPAAYVASLATGKKITVTYTATLNDGAVIASTGNANETNIDYSNQSSQKSKTTVYTYAGALYKFNSAAEELSGASFTMVNASNAAMYFIPITEGNKTTPAVYRYNSTYTATTESATNTITTPGSGAIVIIGLDAGTYTLTESAAPDGYNILSGTQTLTVAATEAALSENVEFTTTDNKKASFVAGTDDTYNSVTYQLASSSVLGIENKAGTELPSTGGIGTTILYIIGAVLVIGAGVFLVAKRRARREIDEQ